MLAFPRECFACVHACMSTRSLHMLLIIPAMGSTCDAGPSLRPDSCVTRRWWQLLHRLSVVYGPPLSSPSPSLCLLYLWTSFISSVTPHDQTWDHNNNSFWLALTPTPIFPLYLGGRISTILTFVHCSFPNWWMLQQKKMQIKCAKCLRVKGDVISDTSDSILFHPRARLTLMWALSPNRNWRWRRLSNLWDIRAEDVGTVYGEL